jgi:hypothetical protein
MKVLYPHELEQEGINSLTYFSDANDTLESTRPFDFAHYHKYEQGNAREHGIALVSAPMDLPSPGEHLPPLTAAIPLGRWSRFGRYESLFEEADTELLTAFLALKESVSGWTGHQFQVQEPCPKNVAVHIHGKGRGLLFGYNSQEITLGRGDKAFIADHRVTKTGLVWNLSRANDENAQRMQRIAANVAILLDTVLATEVVQES